MSAFSRDIPGSAIDPTLTEDSILNEDSGDREPVWTYRGYRIRSGEFNTAMIHFYRGEISRANVWRQRLDATTNWAVVTTGAAISFAFNQSLGQHSLILLNALLITLFLFIEARRYMYYELWSYRIRLMETDFFAAMLVPPFQPGSDWAESLAENLLQPDFPISMWEALGRRFRRNYFWIFTILGLAWALRVGLVPEPVQVSTEFVSRAAIGDIPGQLVISALVLFYLAMLAFGLVTLGLHNASGEVLPHFAGFGLPHIHTNPGAGKRNGRSRAWFRASGRRQQLLAMIITDCHEEVSKQILNEMQRGVTSLSGKGQYTGKDHPVLLCALTVTEVKQLKNLVSRADPHAFVIVTPAHEVLGEGFKPLEDEN